MPDHVHAAKRKVLNGRDGPPGYPCGVGALSDRALLFSLRSQSALDPGER
jgi:hypothetical protein